jgi:translation initiation factor 1
MYSYQKDNPTVFSTEQGRICPNCGKPVAKCICRSKKAVNVRKDGIVRVRLERKGRGGKSVTLIEGITGTEKFLKEIAKELKQICGAGGTVKSGVIELQGDVRDLVLDKLVEKGFSAKKAGS